MREDRHLEAAPQTRSVVCAPGDGRTVPLGDAGVVTLKVEGRDSGASMTAYEFEMPPTTAGPPLHLHRGWDELFFVLAGEMTYLIDGQEQRAPTGSCIFVPRGVVHTFWNAGDRPARQLVVFTPSGIEDYFDDLTKVLTADDDATRDVATSAMARHDMVVPPDARPAYAPLSGLDSPAG